jgi:hypothetical protein
MRAVTTMLSGSGLVVLVSCASQNNAPPQDWISQQWARSMAAYNILPVYPPTEDVYVGDIYAYGTDLTGVEGNLFSSIKIDSVSVEAELKKSYTLHPVFPDTTSKPPTTNDIWEQPGTGDSKQKSNQKSNAPAAAAAAGAPGPAHAAKKQQNPAAAKPGAQQQQAAAQPQRSKPTVSVFENSGVRTKLPLIVFPAFTLANANVEQLGLSVPLRFFQAIFGASSRHADAITIKITAAETYGLPARVAREKFDTWCNTKPTKYSCTAGNARLELGSLRSLSTETPVGLAFVSRVYLARSIEYTYDASTATGVSGDLTVTLQKALDNQKTLQAALTEKAASAPGGASQPNAQEDVAALKNVRASLDALLAQLQRLNEQATGSSAPGASFTVGAVSSQGISLIQTFERPVAIGYRAVTLTPN